MRSVRRTIVVWVVACTLCASVLAVAIAIVAIRSRLIDNFDSHLRLKAEAVASLLEMDDGELELDERDQALGEFQSARNPSYFEVRKPDGMTFERSLSLSGQIAVDLPAATAFETDEVSLPDGRAGRVALLPMMPGGPGEDDDPRPARDAGESERPIAWVIVAAGTEDVRAALKDIVLVLGIGAALVAGCVVLAVPRIIRHGLRPLHELSEQVAKLGPDNLNQTFAADGLPVELVPIAQQLNVSVERLRNAFDRERRFAASAAHELRTPLSAIRANAEVAIKWPEPKRTHEALTHIATSTHRMQSLIERLMEMARLGQATTPRQLESIDVRDLLRSSIELAQPRFDERRMRVEFDPKSTLLIHTDPALLQPMLDNLVSNAADHANEGSTVRIQVDPDRSSIVIANQCDELTSADLPSLFEPLWTRSADRSKAHAGLGLALVAEYTRLLGAHVEPSLSDDGWFHQRVTFPTQSPQSISRP